MITQDDLEWVLKMAEDELDHLERDSKHDINCMEDYHYSKEVFERVREQLTTEGKINGHTK